MIEECPKCNLQVHDYSSPYCDRCGILLGWPNYRKAISERPELDVRYEAAKADLKNRGLDRPLEVLERLVEASQPVVTMDCDACDDLLRDGKYRNYHARVEIGDRHIASEINHGDRLMVNERVYPGYGRHLQYGLLSPDGRGLPNYGPVAVRWRVDPHYLATRATLLEENEFNFFETHNLGGLGTVVPPGYRAVWEDRVKLVVAKLTPKLNASVGVGEISDLLMSAGAERRSDNFVEVVIYARGGIDSRDVDQLALLEPLTDPTSQRKWQGVLETCNNRGIRVVSV